MKKAKKIYFLENLLERTDRAARKVIEDGESFLNIREVFGNTGLPNICRGLFSSILKKLSKKTRGQ